MERGSNSRAGRRLPRCGAAPLAIVLAALAAAGMPGCGSGRPTRVPVSGRVLIDGKPLTLGFIRFTPDDARPASGQIGSDGQFTLMTFEPGDGAVTGKHEVSVMAIEPLSDTTRRWHAPKKYANPKTSGLTVTVQDPTDSLDIELKWEGGKPFLERDGSGT